MLLSTSVTDSEAPENSIEALEAIDAKCYPRETCFLLHTLSQAWNLTQSDHARQVQPAQAILPQHALQI